MKIDIRKAVVGSMVCAAAMASAGAASAQSAAAASSGNFQRDKAVSVKERPHPEYESRGLRLGAFTLDPVLRVTAESSDNIYGVDTGEESDTLIRTEPQFTLTSNWPRHELSIFGNATLDRYLDLDEENSDSWQLGGRGVLDLLRTSKITGNLSLAHRVEPRTSSNTVLTSAIPIEYDQQTVVFTGVHEFNRIRVSGNLSWNAFEYDDGRTAGGVNVDQSYRDRDVTELTGKIDYAVTPDTALFFQVKKDWRDYDDNALLSRSSEGVELLAGVDFELSNLVRGQIGVGWMEQSFDDPAYDDFSGYSLNGRVEWFPTQLTTVTVRAGRSLDDSGLIGSAGIISDQLNLTVDHELRRNIIITATAGLEKNDFLDLNREDDRTSFGLGATYLMNRSVGWTVGFSRLDQDSSGVGAGPDFTVNKGSIGLILKY